MAKNLIHLQLCFFMGLCLLSCTRPQQSPPDTITAVIAAPVSNLDPLFSTDANTQHINELVHGSLLRLGSDLTTIPDLAESYQIQNDTSIAFTLRKNCYFHNGRLLVAADVKKSWELFTAANTKSPFREPLLHIRSIDIQDDWHLTIHTFKPSPALLNNLIALKIIPVESYSPESFTNKPIGAGPFKVISSSLRETILERASKTCIGPTPTYSKLIIKVVRDDLSRLLKLRTGEVDIVSDELNFRKVERVLQNKEPLLSAAVIDGVSFNYLGINMADPALQDHRVREALALSLDIPTLTHYKGRDLQSPARNILSDENFFANRDLPFYARNIPRAKMLLDQAGFFNGDNKKPVLHLQLLTTNNQFAVDNARALASQAKEAGIDVQQLAREWGVFLADIKAKHTQLYLLNWVGATDPSIYAQAFHSGPTGRNNRTNYKNKKLDALVDQAESTMNRAVRKKYYLEVQRILHDDLPYINLWHNKNSAVFRKEISNVALTTNRSWRMFLAMHKEAKP